MTAEKCRPGGHFIAQERGAFGNEPPTREDRAAVELPEIPTFSTKVFVFGHCAVPMFKLSEIVRFATPRG